LNENTDQVKGKKVLVTGAGGFIGSHLTELLVARGATVRAFVRYNSRNDPGMLAYADPEKLAEIEIVPGDLRDPESVSGAAAGRDVIFHLGAQIAIPYSYVNPRDFVETNVLGTLNVAQAALATGVSRLIQVSTSEVYGSAQTIPISESHPLEAQSPYAATKIGADKLIDGFHRSFSLPATIVRPFNTYGPRQSARAVIPTIISQALYSDRVRIGSLHPRRDLTFVTDTAAAFIAATADATLGATVQLGTGVDVSIGEIAEMIAEILDQPLDLEVEKERIRPEASEVERLISTPQKAKELMGWEPTVDLRDGLIKTIAWVKEHPELFKTDEYVR
jgi:NAD dependent epimerase/dehydratase